MTKEEETEEMTMGATMTTIQPNSETHAQRKKKTEREWAFVQVCVCVCVCALVIIRSQRINPFQKFIHGK